MKRLLIITALALSSISARAELFTFYSITDNDPSGYAQFVGESQLFMDVTLLSMGQVSLVFTNAGPAVSSVSRIYFDYNPQLSLSLVAINDGSGVDYDANPTNPKTLPSGNNQMEAFISDLAFSSDNPSPHKGINPYESLELILSYNDSYDFLESLQNEDLRVGLHVISLGGYSESFVNTIPEPATAPLLLLGTVALRWLRIKKSRRGKQNDSFMPCLNHEENNELAWVEIQTGKDRRSMPLTRCEAAIRQMTS
jgi:hypothetical protein